MMDSLEAQTNITADSSGLQNNGKQATKPKKRKPGFHEGMFEETEYYFKRELRFVYPYAFTFTAYIKKRWLGLEILQLFQKEFHMETVEYYKNAISTGKIRVNDEIVSPTKILKNNEVLKTTVHRHEPPVIHKEIEFLKNDDDMVVINKPASVPVHPCGRYRHNTIVFILGKEHGLKQLHTIHRIDRLTSGILMFAKTTGKAREMEKAVHGRNVEKEYLARVVGEFPSDEVLVEEPMITASHKIGVCYVHPDGKPCKTLFQRISFDGHSSVVSCKPYTGRMHQIRVHLQWLGHPIVNDPIYNHPTAWADWIGTKDSNLDIKKVIAELIRTRKDNSYDSQLHTNKPDLEELSPGNESNVVELQNRDEIDGTEIKGDKTDDGPSRKKIKTDQLDVSQCKEAVDEKTEDNCVKEAEIITLKQQENSFVKSEGTHDESNRVVYTSLDIGEQYYNTDCTECKRKWKEPFKSELIMFLHALRYKGPDWEYETTIPPWAKDDYNKIT